MSASLHHTGPSKQPEARQYGTSTSRIDCVTLHLPCDWFCWRVSTHCRSIINKELMLPEEERVQTPIIFFPLIHLLASFTHSPTVFGRLTRSLFQSDWPVEWCWRRSIHFLSRSSNETLFLCIKDNSFENEPEHRLKFHLNTQPIAWIEHNVVNWVQHSIGCVRFDVVSIKSSIFRSLLRWNKLSSPSSLECRVGHDHLHVIISIAVFYQKRSIYSFFVAPWLSLVHLIIVE